MSWTRLDVSGFRNLSSVRLNLLADGFNYFYGKNGSGKTSILESVHYMVYGRSFRTPNPIHLINYTAERFSLFSLRIEPDAPHFPLGVERHRDGHLLAKAAGEALTSFAAIARRFPALLAHSGSHHLLEAGPVFRRKYLDWGAFYQHETFLNLWKQYARALRQRNILLRNRQTGAELDTWSQELIKSGSGLNHAREQFVNRLLPLLKEALEELLFLPDIKMTYYRGWSEALSYAEAIAASTERDRQFCCTQVGPHRADFKLTINGLPLKERLSRGQQKLFIYAMIVAQGALIKQSLENSPIYLLDDLPAELDSESRARLMSLLKAQKAQVLFTGIEPDAYGISPIKMFHVEHGRISEVAS